jgi:16S rRNA (guanine527-N7)-methyltransferase
MQKLPDTSPADSALTAGAAALQVTLSPAQVEQLQAYLDLLQRWNKVYNLTAVRDPQQMLTHHLLDSLAVVAPLRRHLATTGVSPARVLDVGSGGGLPGVVLAVTDPALQVACVDTVGKKVSFVRQVAAELGLRHLSGLHSRVEALPTATRWNVITSRAFASLLDFVTLTRPLLAEGGVWMAMKGQHPQAEIDALPADIEVFHVEPLTVPGLDAERCLVWMRPRAVA